MSFAGATCRGQRCPTEVGCMRKIPSGLGGVECVKNIVKQRSAAASLFAFQRPQSLLCRLPQGSTGGRNHIQVFGRVSNGTNCCSSMIGPPTPRLNPPNFHDGKREEQMEGKTSEVVSFFSPPLISCRRGLMQNRQGEPENGDDCEKKFPVFFFSPDLIP